MGAKRNLTGLRFGKLVAVNDAGKVRNSSRVWNFLCDCGNSKEISSTDVVQGNTQSCGCYILESRTSHGMTKSSEYNSWLAMKARTDPTNSHAIERYVDKGMEESWKTSFESFLNYIGRQPKDSFNYTIERIDNNAGYFVGNVRWATRQEQVRNRAKPINNNSGKTGVSFHVTKYGRTYVMARWHNLNGKQVSKTFSVSVHGLLPAFAKACVYRDKMITELNTQGAGYSESHGK